MKEHDRRYTTSETGHREPTVRADALTQALIDAMRAPTALVDSGGTIVAVNAAWSTGARDRAGLDETCGVGANYLEVCERASGPCSEEALLVAEGLREVLAGTRDEFDLEYPCHGPHTQAWYQVHVTPVRTPGARPYLAVMSHEDITERILAGLRQNELTAEVEREVDHRTQELREANDALDAFAAAVSHDLRAPVRHILGFLELLSRRLGDGRVDATEARLLDLSTRAAGRLNVMIEQLLALSRSSGQSAVREPVRLNDLIQQAWANLTMERADRQITFRVADLPTVQGDAQLLCLAFENLLTNAIKYTARREQAVVEVGYIHGTHEDVVFVRDNGAGFNPKYAHKLFGAFQRLHRESDFSGIGLGLTNVKRIVTRHGGRVWADGHEGRGATFYVALPRD